MASSISFKNMTETDCQCPKHSHQLKDPKLLPCLHRHSRECLTRVIQSASGGIFKCSVCKQDCKIPENGVDGFKTDLHMTSRLLLIKLQDSFVNKDQKQLCGSCSNVSTTPTYCFKCDKFLCQECIEIHLNFGMFQDHRPHTLNFETIKEKNLTSEIISQFMVYPMCVDHRRERAQLCCSTCKGVPICVTCVTDMHKGHELCDVVDLAKSERESLEAMRSDISKQEIELNEIPVWVMAKKLQLQSKQTEISTMREKMKRDVKYRKERAINQLQFKFNEDKKKLVQEYDQKFKEVEEQQDKIEADCQSELDKISKKVQELTAKEEYEKELEEIFESCKQLIERIENSKATSSSILDSKDFWSDAQCIPYFRTADESLVKDMERLGSSPLLNGTFKLCTSSCICCDHIHQSKTFTSHLGDKKEYKTKGYITCRSSNVIYLIYCNKCKLQYVGKTSKSLKVRFSKHTSVVGQNEKANSPIVQHFNSANHTVDDMKLQGIISFSSDENLLTEEKSWMEKLRTNTKDGLN